MNHTLRVRMQPTEFSRFYIFPNIQSLYTKYQMCFIVIDTSINISSPLELFSERIGFPGYQHLVQIQVKRELCQSRSHTTPRAKF